LKGLIRTTLHSLAWSIVAVAFCSNISLAGSATILLYHKFGNPSSPSTNTPIENFKKQMQYLKTHHYNVLKLSTLCNLIKNHKDIPDKTVGISIDDGYRSTAKAVDILKKYNFPATIFLYADAYSGWPAFLSWTQIRQIVSDPLFDIGNHTASHAELDRLGAVRIGKEISTAQALIKKFTGVDAVLFAYPYGYYNAKVIRVLRNYKFKCAFSQDVGAVDAQSDLYKIPRIAMTGSNLNMAEFEKKLNIKPLHLLNYFPKQTIRSNETVKVVLKYPKNYSTVKIYISENGWLKTDFNRKIGTAYAKAKNISRFRNRIVIKAFNKMTKRYSYFTWMVHKSDSILQKTTYCYHQKRQAVTR